MVLLFLMLTTLVAEFSVRTCVNGNPTDQASNELLSWCTKPECLCFVNSLQQTLEQVLFQIGYKTSLKIDAHTSRMFNSSFLPKIRSKFLQQENISKNELCAQFLHVAKDYNTESILFFNDELNDRWNELRNKIFQLLTPLNSLRLELVEKASLLNVKLEAAEQKIAEYSEKFIEMEKNMESMRLNLASLSSLSFSSILSSSSSSSSASTPFSSAPSFSLSSLSPLVSISSSSLSSPSPSSSSSLSSSSLSSPSPSPSPSLPSSSLSSLSLSSSLSSPSSPSLSPSSSSLLSSSPSSLPSLSSSSSSSSSLPSSSLSSSPSLSPLSLSLSNQSRSRKRKVDSSASILAVRVRPPTRAVPSSILSLGNGWFTHDGRHVPITRSRLRSKTSA